MRRSVTSHDGRFGYWFTLSTRHLIIIGLVGILGVVPLMTSAGATAKTEIVVKTMKIARYGPVLVTLKRFVLYTYSKDAKNRSNCEGTCLSVWPALYVRAGVVPRGEGVTKLGKFRRSNGRYQVTYEGRPLYLFVSDKRPGDVTGQGVAGFAVATVSKVVTKTGGSTSYAKSKGGGSW